MSESYQVQPKRFHRGVPWYWSRSGRSESGTPSPTYARITQLRSSQVDMWQSVISLRSCPASGSIQCAELKLPWAPQKQRGVGIQRNCTHCPRISQGITGGHCHGVRCLGCGVAYRSDCVILRHSWSQLRSRDQAPRERGAFASA